MIVNPHYTHIPFFNVDYYTVYVSRTMAVERWIAQHPIMAINYIVYTLDSAWPLAEPALKKNRGLMDYYEGFVEGVAAR